MTTIQSTPLTQEWVVQAWVSGRGSNALWKAVSVMADSFAIDAGALKFERNGVLVKAFAENTWQNVGEAEAD